MQTHRPLVLVVDDDEDIRLMLGWVLESSGYRVWCAPDGEAALAYVRAGQDPPALALVDLMMPHMDGETLVRELRRTPATTDLPIVVLSGHGAACASAAAARASACLAKPVEIDELLDLVQRLTTPPALAA